MWRSIFCDQIFWTTTINLYNALAACWAVYWLTLSLLVQNSKSYLSMQITRGIVDNKLDQWEHESHLLLYNINKTRVILLCLLLFFLAHVLPGFYLKKVLCLQTICTVDYTRVLRKVKDSNSNYSSAHSGGARRHSTVPCRMTLIGSKIKTKRKCIKIEPVSYEYLRSYEREIIFQFWKCLHCLAVLMH